MDATFFCFACLVKHTLTTSSCIYSSVFFFSLVISTIPVLWCERCTTMMEFQTKFTYLIKCRRRWWKRTRCEQSSLHYLHWQTLVNQNEMFDLCSLHLSFVFLFELPPTMKIHIFIYRKVSVRIELVVSHLISSHLVCIVLFSFRRNLYIRSCVYQFQGQKWTKNRKKMHTRTELYVLFASHFVMCDKGKNWKKIWIWKFTTWSCFKWCRILVEYEKVSLSV